MISRLVLSVAVSRFICLSRLSPFSTKQVYHLRGSSTIPEIWDCLTPADRICLEGEVRTAAGSESLETSRRRAFLNTCSTSVLFLAHAACAVNSGGGSQPERRTLSRKGSRRCKLIRPGRGNPSTIP